MSDLHPYGSGSHAPLADAREMPDCYPIKGNVDSMLYHRPDSANYGATVAEVWFVSPSVAEAAGFGLSRTHPKDSSSADFEPGGSGHPCTAGQLADMGMGALAQPYGPGSHAPLADAREMPGCYPIKGNVDSMLYHRPDSANYGATVAEVWFVSPSAAEAAGFGLSNTHPKGSSSADFEPGAAGHPCTAGELVSIGLGILVHPYGISSRAPLANVREMPECYPIKGNVDSMLYHRPDSANYGATVAEMWFVSPSAAEAAGFSLSNTHPKDSSSADFELDGTSHPCTAAQFAALGASLMPSSGASQQGVATAGAGVTGIAAGISDEASSDGGSNLAAAAGVAAVAGAAGLAASAATGGGADEAAAAAEKAAAEKAASEKAAAEKAAAEKAAAEKAASEKAAAEKAAAEKAASERAAAEKAASERAAAEKAASEKAAADKAAAEKAASEKAASEKAAAEKAASEKAAAEKAASQGAAVAAAGGGSGAAGSPPATGGGGSDEQPFGPGSRAPFADVHEMPECHPIKGNADSMKYHRPDSQGYPKTKAEVWFVSPSVAEAAGFTLAGSHPEGSSSADFEPGGSEHPCSGAEIDALGLGVLGFAAAAGSGDVRETVRMSTPAGDTRETIQMATPAGADEMPFGLGSRAPLSDVHEMPACHPIKGNADSMKYHRPDSQGYAQTKAEVWFVSPSVAEAAGFALAGSHPDGSSSADFEPGASGHPCTAAQLRTLGLGGLGFATVASEAEDDEGGIGAGAVAAGAGVAALAGAAALLGKDDDEEKAAADKAAADKAAAEKAAADKAAAEKAAADKAAADKAAADKAAADKAAADKAAADKAAADKAAADKAAADKAAADKAAADKAAADKAAAEKAAAEKAAADKAAEDESGISGAAVAAGAGAAALGAAALLGRDDDDDEPDTIRQTVDEKTDARETIRRSADDEGGVSKKAAAAAAAGAAGVAGAAAMAGKGAGAAKGVAGDVAGTATGAAGKVRAGVGGGGGDDDDRELAAAGGGFPGWLKWLLPLLLLALLLGLLLALCGGDDDDVAADAVAAAVDDPTAIPATAVPPTAVPEPDPTATPEPEPTATPEPEPTATPEPEPTAVTAASCASLVSVLEENGFTTLVAAAGVADVAGALSDSGALTLFAPTEAAFAKVPPEITAALLGDPALLTSVLQYHVVPGAVMSGDLAPSSVQTLNGSTLAVRTDLGPPTVNASGIAQADLEADECVVHGVDSVLVPPALLATLGVETLNAAVGGSAITFADGTADFTDADSATLAAICNLVSGEDSVDDLPPVQWESSGDAAVDAARAAAIDDALASCGPGGLPTDQLAPEPSFTG